MNKQLTVGIGDMKLTRREGVLITYALGSCIGVSFYDPMIQLGALLHVMLPEAVGNDNIFKYADSGIRETLRKFQAFGGMKGRIICKIAGGAKMFNLQDGASIGNIGQRNIDSVKSVLRMEGIRIRGEDTGGDYARTMSVDMTNGNVKIKTYGRAEINL